MNLTGMSGKQEASKWAKTKIVYFTSSQIIGCSYAHVFRATYSLKILVNYPASEYLCVPIFGFTSVFDLWSRSWGLACLVCAGAD